MGVHRDHPAAARARRGSIVPSLPGYGFSFTPGGRRSIVDCADALHGLMRLARPRPLPRRRRRLGRAHRRAPGVRVPGRRAGAAPVHDAAATARDVAGVGDRRRAPRSSPGPQEEGGYVAHPGHAAADPRLRAGRLARRPDELDRREVRPLDRHARRPARRRPDDHDDLLVTGLDRLVVLALLRAQARRLGARRRRRRRRADAPRR